jgi:hypothetical protein
MFFFFWSFAIQRERYRDVNANRAHLISDTDIREFLSHMPSIRRFHIIWVQAVVIYFSRIHQVALFVLLFLD